MFSKNFQDMINPIAGYYPHAKPSVASHSNNLIPWLDFFGISCHRSPCVFLKFFGKLSAISKEVGEKFRIAAEDKKKASSSLPQWGQVYHFREQGNFHNAPKVNDSFSRLLTKQVGSSHSLSLSLEDSAKLEACIRGQIQSQSFSLWALAAISEFLKDSNCVPDDPVFHQLVTSMTDAINAQARASFFSASFLKQKC